jgi:hypothetical protein
MKLQTIILTSAMAAAMTGCNRDSGVMEMTPSRSAQSGCQWVESGDTALGVKFLVEECGGKRPPVVRKANVVEIGESGARIEVYGKHFAQPAVAAIKEQFLSRLSEKELAGCIVKARPDGVKIPQSMQSFAIVPGPDYMAAAKARRDADPNAFICGDHGQGPVQGFFLGEQGTSGGRLAYVSAGSGNSGFDPMSVRFETDKAMAERLEKLAPENLATAELLAFALESDLKRYKESRGQFTEGESESSFIVFSKNGAPAVLVGQFKVSDKTDGAVRAYFKDGRLFLVRESLLATAGGISRSQVVIWKRMAFDTGGKLIESRKVVDGDAAELLPGEVEESVKAVEAMLKRGKS